MTVSASRRADIPSLTGLRGLAAWLVVFAHTDGFFTAKMPAALDYGIRVGANLGMTIFFVLSGFVIHYNYGAAIANKGPPAILSFLRARFARLYPLYLLALLINIAIEPSVLNDDAFAVWIWRYLTMTQDWAPTLVDGKLLATLYVGITWSLSAEAALYIFFLVCAFPVSKIEHRRSVLIALIVMSAAGIVFMIGYATGTWFSGIALANWWFSLSPIARAPEFLLGALLAQLYVLGPDPHPPSTESRLHFVGAVGALWIISVFAACYAYPALQLTFGFAPGLVLLIYYFARCRLWSGTLFESRVMLVLGDASYSTYILHGFVLWYVFKQTPYVPTAFRIMLAWGLIVVLSVAVYRYFEVPSRRYIRTLRWGRPAAMTGPRASNSQLPI